jgi:hypothetical protein
MKFGIREGFVVNQSKLVEVNINGEKTKQLQENSYFPGQEVDFGVDDAENHLHKLIPLDKEAKAYVDTRTAKVSAPVAAVGLDGAALAALVAAAVAQALAAQVPAPVA